MKKLNHYTTKINGNPLNYAIKGQMTVRSQAHAGKVALSKPVGHMPKRGHK